MTTQQEQTGHRLPARSSYRTGTIPNPEDAVENKLDQAVCSALIPLATAQKAIAADWVTAFDDAGLRVAGGKVCLRSPGSAPFTLLAPFFAPDVVLYQADALPYGGVWRGHEGLEQFFLAMSQTWDIFEMVNQEFLAATSPLAILTNVHARARATSRELHFPILQTVTVEEERITEVRPFYWDTTAIANACSPG